MTKQLPRTLLEVMIEPVGFCNLNCKYCYTPKINATLPKEQIITFIERYLEYMNGKGTINLFWIGRGEVTLYRELPNIVNYLNLKYNSRITHYIQTNGIFINPIIAIESHDNITISVSLDGFTHDQNRGIGTFTIIEENIKKLVSLKFKVNVHAIVTPENVMTMPQFIKHIKKISPIISTTFAILYAPKRKNEIQQTLKQMRKMPQVMKGMGMDDDVKRDDKIYLSLSCEGIVYNCCELLQKVGSIDDSIPDIIKQFETIDNCPSCKFYQDCLRKYLN